MNNLRRRPKTPQAIPSVSAAEPTWLSAAFLMPLFAVLGTCGRGNATAFVEANSIRTIRVVVNLRNDFIYIFAACEGIVLHVFVMTCLRRIWARRSSWEIENWIAVFMPGSSSDSYLINPSLSLKIRVVVQVITGAQHSALVSPYLIKGIIKTNVPAEELKNLWTRFCLDLQDPE